ncbi:MAG: ATP-binding protein [Chloroflexota bacterium]
MNQTDFIGRESELELLDGLWTSSKARLLILYGRRRVGKTRLLTHWIKQHKEDGLYWVAEPTSALDQLRSFSRALATFADPEMPPPPDFSYATWEHALRQVALLSRTRRIALFIDEVTYLIDVNPTFVGTLQKAWDMWLSKANLFLAMSGSQMGLMQKELLSYQAPLYGRATAQVQLHPLSFSTSQQFFPQYTPTERVSLYAIFGGIPAYWERLNGQASVMENLSQQLSPSNALMYDEPRILLQDFINDPHNYVGIMRAIAHGAQMMSDICKRTGLSKGHTSKYLSILRDTGFVTRQVPVTENQAKSRRGRYFVTDPYLRFYYRFLAAYQSMLALGEQQEMLQEIERELPQFIEQNTWRELCREWLLRASARKKLPVSVKKVGGDWKRHQAIDVVGLDTDQKHVVLGTCIWDGKAIDSEPLTQLVKQTSSVVPKGDDWHVYYIGFSAHGWTEQARETARQISKSPDWHVAGMRLLNLDEVDADLIRWPGMSVN